MTQEEKQLLLKDLCSRLPYGVKIKFDSIKETVFTISELGYLFDSNHDITPYLRPMSSMTQEEMDNFQQCLNIIENENYGDGWSPAAWGQMAEFIHYCNEHHLDYNGLIAMRLALEAPEGMYNIIIDTK